MPFHNTFIEIHLIMIRAATVDFWQERQPYDCHCCRCALLHPLQSILKNPGKTAVLAVLPLVAALNVVGQNHESSESL